MPSILRPSTACAVAMLVAIRPICGIASEFPSNSNKQLVLEPKSAIKPDETYAALVISRDEFSDVLFTGDFETIAQLRTGTHPNAWETAWALFNFKDNKHFYYVAFKTNGWELGKADPAYPGDQRYLATGNDMPSPVGTKRRFGIETVGARITVTLEGRLLTTFTDTERPYLSGKVGLYTEDAKVAFDNIGGSLTDNFDGYSEHRFADNDTLGNVWTVSFVGYGSGAIESVGARTSSATPIR